MIKRVLRIMLLAKNTAIKHLVIRYNVSLFLAYCVPLSCSILFGYRSTNEIFKLLNENYFNFSAFKGPETMEEEEEEEMAELNRELIVR